VVIPVYDVNPVRRTPWVTYLLIAANVVVFLLTPAARDTGMSNVGAAELCRQQAFYDRYAAVPRELVDNKQLPAVPTGEVGVAGRAVGCVVRTPWYHKVPAVSVLYSMFLHGGWLHLLGNMLFLWVFGNNVEDRFGRLRFLLFYLGVGVLSTYAFALTGPDSEQPLVGASGAISGVLGAYLLLFPRARVLGLVSFLFFLPLRLPAWLVLGFYFVLQAVYAYGVGLTGGGSVAYLVHVVGFALGAGVVVLFGGRLRDFPRPAPGRRRLS
jgi:membrane associated rhomboid family serine protease